ncbi:ABC transporter ATP-binding protein, partial [Georgenia sp. 10Sc9-8]|nr:ABC transporter ATP-binding protein [Georgenia halotolerans]
MLLRLLRDFLGPYARDVWFIVTLQVIQTLAALSLPSLNADIIDNGVVAGNTDYILRVGVVMLGLTALQIVSAITGVYLAARTAMGVGRDVRHALFDRVQAFSAEEMGRFGAPSLITRTTNDVQQVQMVTLLTFTIMVMAPLMMAGGVIMALRQDAALSGLLLVSVPVLLGVLGVMILLMRPLFRQVQERLDRINLVMREQIAGVRVIRSFVREDAERERFEDANTRLMRTALAVGRLMALAFPAVMVVVNLSQVAVIWFGGARIDAGQMEVGALVAFLNYLMLILMSVLMAVMMFMMVPRAEVGAERISAVLGTVPSVARPADPVPVPAHAPGTASTALQVDLHGVDFGYPGAEEPVLHDLTLTLPPGRTTAVVGSTGAGKSTLVNLLPRLLDATAG